MSSTPRKSEITESKPIPHELLEEMLLELAVKNHNRVQNCKIGEYLWSSDVAEFVFNVCEEFKLKRNVKYLAIEIYERFIPLHIVDVHYKHAELLKSKKPSSWTAIEGRLREQTVLRLLTAVQLASKLESHYDHVLPRQISEMLERSRKPYSLNGIFSSELRVMRAMDYDVNVTTPALYMGMLLYILYANDPGVDENLYESAVAVLDFAYLHRAELYAALYGALVGEFGEGEPDFNPGFLRVKADYMLLAAAIVASTAYMFANPNYELILEQLYQITRIMKKDIRNFSIVITYMVTNETSD